MLEVRGSAKLRFQLLGKATIEDDSGIVRISSQKGFALLAYLAMHRGRALNRTVLADLLWGDRGEASARQNLRQSIHTLRRDLGPMHSGMLRVDDQSISLPADATEVDALHFMACAQNVDPAARLRCLDIPWGPFLRGLSVDSEAFDEWVVAERHRLDAVATRTFSDIATHLDASGNGERAILALERLIAIDSAEEERHRRILLLEARYRGPDAALARAKELAAMLRRELDADPEPATNALIADIRRSAEDARSAGGVHLRAPSVNSAVADRVPDIGPPTHVAPAAKEPSATARRWLPNMQLPGWRSFGVPAILMLIAVSVVLVLTNNRRPTAVLTEERVAIEKSQVSDPWTSPPLPSGRVAAGGADQRKGTIPIVVMPFTTYDESGSIRLLAEMMTDDVTNILSRIRYFRVISRQTARSLQKQQINVATKGEELGIRYVLEGSIRKHDDKLRVTVELTDTATLTVVWSARFEREDADRHKVQDEIVGRLVRELQIGSFSVESTRLSNDPGADALAYRGMAALHAAISNISLDAYQKAEALFAQALERDPRNVLARLGLGSYHANVAVQRLVPDPDSHLQKAHEIITGVIQQIPTISGAHHQLGIILQGSGKLKEAIEAFERAVEINPSSAGSYAHTGFALARMGRATEGLEHIRYAMRLSPRDPSLAIWLEFAGAAELELDHYPQAIENFRHSIALTPAYPRPWAGLVAAQALAGDMGAAHVSADKLKILAPGLTTTQLFQRFGRGSTQSPRLREGLRIALALTANH